LRRPFSQEALQSSKSLYTIERGLLYQDFLSGATGYSDYDLGLVAYGGFEDEGVPVGYEIGVFNGKQKDSVQGSYAGQQYRDTDRGFKAKDMVFRLAASPVSSLKVEGDVSTKAAEDESSADNFIYAVNTAYQVGLDFTYGRLRALAEAAWGDNHQGIDARIVDGSRPFFAFYAMGVWREDYVLGRASELVLKVEGLDPDARKVKPNDGQLRYTLGCNYFFTPRISFLADYGVLHPITEVPGDKDLSHDIDVMWRMSF